MGGELSKGPVLVTGATGFVGRAVALRLLSQGVPVRAMVRDVRKSGGLVERGAEIRFGEMRDSWSIEKAVEGCSSVVHCAAVIGKNNEPWQEFYEVNVEGTRRLALCGRAHGIGRFVVVSSIAVFGLEPGTRVREDSPRMPSGFPYTDSKLAQDETIGRLARRIGLPAITLYPTQIYGPGDTGWTGIPLNLIRSGRLALADGGHGLIQPLFIEDFVEAVRLALERGLVGEGYIITGPREVTVREFFSRLAQIAGEDQLRELPAWLLLAKARANEFFARLTRTTPAFTRLEVLAGTRSSTYDGSKAANQLGFSPVFGLESGMERVEESLTSSLPLQ